MALTLIGDVHLGLRRQRGVTKESLARYESRQLAALGDALAFGVGDSPVILGDLFDTFTAGYALVIKLLRLLPAGRTVWVLQGNHDVSRDAGKAGALGFLGAVRPLVTVIDTPTVLQGIAFVPHVPTQGAFDECVSWAAEESDVLITHANFDNPFAAEKTHSLNLSPEQADQFKLVISGHEHVPRDVGHVHMLGSLLPTQVSEAGHRPGVATITPERGFYRADLQPYSCRAVDIADSGAANPCDFVKITGKAKVAEAADVASRVEEIFSESGAMMFQNAVELEGMNVGEVAEAAGNIETFDPVRLLLELLPTAIGERLRGLGLC